eukprot:Skav227347  [mRNA]  locus=scaffold1665:88506:88769:- [translate_table: standard]
MLLGAPCAAEIKHSSGSGGALTSPSSKCGKMHKPSSATSSAPWAEVEFHVERCEFHSISLHITVAAAAGSAAAPPGSKATACGHDES